MSCHPGISSLVAYGAEGELLLTSILCDIVGETISKTSGTFDTMDFEGETTFSELKRRSSDFFYCDTKIKEEGWLMPSCKVIKSWEKLSEGKKVFFFYFWMRDKSLWYYEMKEGDFSKEEHKPPKNHYDKQLHVTIQEDKWKRCNVDCSSIVFEEDKCWIE